ncbi:MAG TPA: M12 family metallo-peptidase [Steroidobacteraceae bacterium]|nr:M12 family metallo-peptidase [Steroidobacteraceae bacterium]
MHQSAIAGSAQILYYEPLRADAAAASNATQKPTGEFAYSFDAFGRRFDLALSRNERIALSKPTNGGAALRLYKGDIKGTDGSWVRLGVQGQRVQGMLWDGHELYVIEPVDSAQADVVPPLALPASGSIVFRLSDTKLQTPASCGSNASAAKASGLAQYTAMVAELKATSSAIIASNPTRRIELSAMGDALYRQSHPSDQSAADQILLRLNNVDGIFSSQIGVAIQVPTVIIEDPNGTAFSSTTSSSALLNELALLRKNSPQLRSRGLTHLFTGRDLDGDTVGIAYIDSLCDEQWGVGLTQAHNLNVWIESLIAAHELGHNFGAYHDGEDAPGTNPGECTGTPDNLYLMAPRVEADHTQFSTCSRTTVRGHAMSAACITPISTADLGVAPDLGQTRALAGTTFDWSFDVSNVGSATANDGKAKAFLPPSISIVEAWVTGGTCTGGAGLIDCDLGSLAGGVTRTINARLRSDDMASNTVVVHVSASNDAGMNNNQSQGSIDIEPDVDLAIELAAPGTGWAAQPLSGSITLRNLSPRPAQSLTLDLTGAVGLNLASVNLEGASCTVSGNHIQCAVSSLDSGGVLTGSITVTAPAAGSYALNGEIGSSALDGNPSNNAATAAIQVAAAATSATEGQNSSGSGGGGSLGRELLMLALLWPLARRRSQATA